MSLAEWKAMHVARHAPMELVVRARARGQGATYKLRVDRARAAARAAAIEKAHLMIPGVAYGVRLPLAHTMHRSTGGAPKACESEAASNEGQGVAEGLSQKLEELDRLRAALRKKALAGSAEKQRARDAAVEEVARRFREWRDWARGTVQAPECL